MAQDSGAVDEQTSPPATISSDPTLINEYTKCLVFHKTHFGKCHSNVASPLHLLASTLDSTASSTDFQNCVDAYPTFLAVLWTAGLLCSQVPAAFAGLMYLFVRQKYFVGYLGERTQSTPGYIFGKRIILFLFLMSLAGILNYYLILFFGSDFENYIKTITTTISPLLLIP
ncbi:arachidonate 5-lipoxygenase-activating protein isoform X1 [Microcebus murinus]|uniref:arachidonate 5-lipoxygenase-activating protein isoform X1 n=1 Tax=Microcebus murinus TaxID=30608 RepID=UPI003F6C0EEB